MRIAALFDKTRADTTGVYLECALRRLGCSIDHWWVRDAARIPAIYDVYLRVDYGDDYLIPLPEALRPSVFYAIDTHLPHSWKKIRRSASRYDFIYCAQRAAAERLRNAEWLPLASEAPATTEQILRTALRWDVAFVGNDGGIPRKFYLQALRERYPRSRIGQAESTQMPHIYGHAAVGFNYSIAQDVNMRIFEVLMAGALLVTNALAHDDLQRLGLKDRQHLLCYRTPQELYALIDAALRDPEQRETIAQAGAAIARARHSYTHRARQLVHSVSQRFGLTLPESVMKPEPETMPCVSSALTTHVQTRVVKAEFQARWNHSTSGSTILI